MSLSRRDFLHATSAAGGGLALGIWLDDLLSVHAAAPDVPFEPNVFLRIALDETVTLCVVRFEMGQGVRTLLPMMIAEELEVDWGRIRIEQAEPGGRFIGIRMHTAGSSSSSGTYLRLRTAGAAAREMLIAAAAMTWNVDPSACAASRGRVMHTPTGRQLTYGALAPAAAKLPVPAVPTLKDRASFRLLGKPMKRTDGPAMIAGRAQYGTDVRVPGMLFASIERAPSFGTTLVGFDSKRALQTAGVQHVIAVTSGIHPGVAVVASDTWSALRGRAALSIEWKPGPHSSFDSELFLQHLPQALDRADFKVRHEGDAIAALASAVRRHEATYLFPFQAHAPLETMNCTADVRKDSAEIWVPTQTDVRTLDQIRKVTGLSDGAIRIHPLLMGGGFGRRLFADYAAEAAEISKAIGRPVQMMWTREDDMRCGYFHPATVERFTAGLDATGTIVALLHKTSASDLTIYDIHAGRNIWRDQAVAKKSDHYESGQSPWGAYDTPYEFAALRVDCADVTSAVPVGPWRAVEYPSTVFARESFLDEIAALVGKDPIALRLELLPRDVKRVGPYAIDRGRLTRVLEAVRERSGWQKPAESERGWRRARGVAANAYHAQSYLAMVAEVSVSDDASRIRVDRMVTAVDVGIALNPLGLLGQTESGIAWGLSAALGGKIDFKNGAPIQSTYADFEVLRFRDMPVLDTVIVDSGGRPGGYGEHPVPLVAPAIANAIFAATGRRLRELPLVPAQLRS